MTKAKSTISLKEPQTEEDSVIQKIEFIRNVRGLPKLATSTLRSYLKRTNPKNRTSKLYLLLANLYIDIGETKKAEAAFRLAERKARDNNIPVLLADILRKLGYLYLHTDKIFNRAYEKITESVEIIDESLKRNVSNESIRVAANCYASLGNYYFDSHNNKQAEEAYKKALVFCEKSGYEEREVTVLGDLGNVALRKEKWSDALKFLNLVISRANKFYRHALPSALLRMGRLHARKQNPKYDTEKAKEYFLKSLRVSRKEGWKREEADALYELGSFYKELGKTQKGTELQEEALRIYKKLKYYKKIIS